MLPVEIHPIQDALVLRARGSELLILADHVAELKKLKSAGDFSKYFLDEALVNRPARKLFEAWLRKDGSLWARIYKTVQTIESSNSAHTSPDKPAAVAQSIRVAAKESPNKDSTKVDTPQVSKAPAKSADHPDNKKDQKKDEKRSTDAGVKAGKATGPAVDKTVDKAVGKTVAKMSAKQADGKSASKQSAKSASATESKTSSKSPSKPAGTTSVKTNVKATAKAPAKTATKKSSKK